MEKGMEKGWEKGCWEKGYDKGFDKGSFDKGGFDKGCEGKGFWKGGGGGGKGKNEEMQELGHFTGVIKSFNPKSGYGFITCMELQRMGFSNDVFLHHQQMNDCTVGMEVTFNCFLNSKGQPQAREVSSADGPALKRMRMDS
mmetsp:Transcript_90753/g.265635  ORF Transcript_90753/g.265635 Transcript_90753/m.265635 type:complete len:141 (+) Transcript_90753:1-423(+)